MLSPVDFKNCGEKGELPASADDDKLWIIVFTLVLYLFDYELLHVHRIYNIQPQPSAEFA